METEIWLGDCLEKMKDIPRGSVDLVLCDLPYGTTKCCWDSVLPLDELWAHYNRVCKEDAAILLFAQTPFDKVLGASNLKQLRYEWIWEKTQATGHLNATRMPMKAHENILVFYRRLPTYNPQITLGHAPTNANFRSIASQNKTEVYGKATKDLSGGGKTTRFPRSVLGFSSDKQKMKNTGFRHPTQKPLALCEYLVETYSNEGDLVLDNCAGSGTSLLAAKNLNRRFLGIEKDRRYYEMCLKRLEQPSPF